ncbi:hypothetical protein [uncultured Mucilaginibacter sp.]|uniref:hypothetical protein n=1 Tax=uncultured Mucilaginibacter sp. TaxID=797541 RepID=UPI0025E43E56|nr:hypothetical protein [uncultured Mucilaginibacter sp.]
MKYLVYFLLFYITISETASGQKIEQINSGETIKRGAALYDSGQYKSALIELNKVNRSDTNYVWSVYEKALTCEADSQYSQAIKYCEEGLALKEQREYEAELYNTYGNTLNEMGQPEKALKIFDAALARYPVYSLFYYNKGVVMLGLNKLEEAEHLFQQSLVINPYMYSAHFQLGVAALKQGKIIPAFLSLTGYLLVNPEGRFWQKSVNLLNQISKGTDEILQLKNKRTISQSENYQEAEDILLSKIALDNAYKPVSSLDDPICRQIQAMFEKLEFKDDDGDFWIQYYLPYYKKVFNEGKFEPFIYEIFSNVKLQVIQDYTKKNKKTLEAFTNDAADYFNNIRATRVLKKKDRDTVSRRYYYENGLLFGKGLLVNNGKMLNGYWEFYYPQGTIKSKGIFDARGERDGTWLIYFRSGKLKAKETSSNGKLEGVQEYYFENGNPSSIENYTHGDPDGLVTTYYYGGYTRSVTRYKAGKKDGEVKKYFSNGNLESTDTYSNGVQNGTSKAYFKSGALKEVEQYSNGKAEGIYKAYHENGTIATEGQNIKDNADGEWKYYYDKGKLQEKRNYVNGLEDGNHEEYYEGGQLSASYQSKKGKENGESDLIDKDGKVFGKYIYDNGIVKSAKYFDKSGVQLSAAEKIDDIFNIITYTPDGHKKAHLYYNKKGDLDGPDTTFYPSGKIAAVTYYKSGKENGIAVSYYLNGTIKTEVNMTDGKENGLYTGYYLNGRPETSGWFADGEWQGEWQFYDEAGRITTKSYYLDGDLDGYKELFHPDGKKYTEEKYKTGWLEKLTQFDDAGNVMAVDSLPKSSGKYTLVYPGGKTMEQGCYVNGEFEGPYKTYYFDGSLESSYFYKKGVRDSSFVSYIYGGLKKSEGMYKNGSKTGVWREYNDDGKLTSTLQYENDALNGAKTYYLPNGSKYIVSVYKDDLLEGAEQRFDPDGTLAYEVYFEGDRAKAYSYLDKDGKLLAPIPISSVNGVMKSYYPNGKPSRDCTYNDGKKNGIELVYYNNGQLLSSDTASYGLSNGVYREYYKNGKPKSVYRYIIDNADGVCSDFDENGALKIEKTFDVGMSDGPAKYYENGKLVKTMIYRDGTLISSKNEK